MKKRLLPIMLLSAFMLIGCGNNTKSSSSSSTGGEAGTISISNKDELKAEWHAGESPRTLKLACEPATNITQAMLKGDITITSSDTSVISVNGLNINALKAGTATVTANYVAHPATDTVEITVLDEIKEPEVITNKTLNDIVSDAKVHAQLYEVEVEIKSWQNDEKTDATKYGNFYVNDGSLTDNIIVYGATASEDAFSFDAGTYKFTNPQDFLENEKTKDIAIGDKLKMRVDYLTYNSTPELEGIVLSVEKAAQTDPTAITVKGSTTAQVGLTEKYTVSYEPASANHNTAVTWSVSDETVARINSSGVIDPLKEGTVSVIATLKSDASIKSSLEVTVGAASVTEPEYIKVAPAETTDVYLGLLQVNNKKVLYATGELSGNYLASSTKTSDAAKASLIVVEGGYNVKIGDKYLGLTSENKAALNDTATLFTFDTIAYTLVTKVGDTQYYFGTYNTYDTFSVSKYNYLVSDGKVIIGQCPMRLYTSLPESEPEVEPDLVVDFSKDNGVSSSTVSVNSTFTVNDITYGYVGGKQGTKYKTEINEYLMLYKDNSGSFWNETAYSKDIKAIRITVGSDASPAAEYSVTFGTSMMQGQIAKANASEVKVIGNNSASYIFGCSIEGAKFFNLSAFTRNCQVALFEVFYVA